MWGKLKPVQFGLTTAIVWGLYVFFLGIMATYFNWGIEARSVVGSIYPGYRRGLSGSAIGTLWAICDGFFGGLIFAWIYNALTGRKCTCQQAKR